MRIVLLGPGKSIHTIRWANGLAERGHDVHLVSIHGIAGGIHQNITGHEIKLRAPFGYFAGRRFRELLAKIQPDLLNVHYASGYGLLARFSGFHPTLLSVWGSDVYDFPRISSLHRMILSKNLRFADAIASTSYAMKTEVLRYVSGKIIFITPFGIDENQFAPASSTFNEEHKNIVVGTVKTLRPKYGIDTLIRAFAETRSGLLESNPILANRLKLLIVGEGYLRNRLERLARDLGITHVTEFRGAVSHSTVPNCLREMDVYVALSRNDSESFGVAILEASACGIPVLVSDADGPAEVTCDEVTGFIVRRDDVHAAATKLLRLVSDPKLRSQMGGAGRSHVLQKYTWAHSLDLMIGAYKKVLGQPSTLK